MLIYETGAMFKPHTGTEKIPGIFGTLVVCLPSPHQGGDLVLRHPGQTKVIETSEVQPSIACWYSDVSHEVLPVTSLRTLKHTDFAHVQCLEATSAELEFDVFLAVLEKEESGDCGGPISWGSTDGRAKSTMTGSVGSRLASLTKTKMTGTARRDGTALKRCLI
ncbi:hypothetical protein B0T26DRAFT_367319 [Lasiosphaeria miniovina]|uniref:Prolyl 4-hydroxylase alpha subunit Fe(2+) 2OG dioxygenase domain-containing protein n=1 Tax=Lasiosphaeria miniovina TaxID=1954250 RepID=A0AA40AD55_9PEZI|nr:uncharacterized protein B0T26DRAFT_367319 [Lasiosphaeria miniovina]KAK0713605.1 hypothetical protein B0T26DRAFT_367319 [Lasiosphaeria miniovina]